MWTWSQSGKLMDPLGKFVTNGYSGKGTGKNNPLMQSVPNVGPVPQGIYMIMPPVTTAKHGPFALALLADPENKMFGRSAFLIHGDSLEHPGEASEGCIILPRPVREKIWYSGDHTLEVIA